MKEPEKKETSFAAKVVIVLIAAIALITYMTPNLDRLQRFDTPVNKLYLLSFISNPEALYMASEQWQQQNKYDNAIRDMRLAIGLLELHSADRQVLQRYRDRLAMLEKKN